MKNRYVSKLLEKAIPPPPPPDPCQKRQMLWCYYRALTHVMLLARVIVLTCFMVISSSPWVHIIKYLLSIVKIDSDVISG